MSIGVNNDCTWLLCTNSNLVWILIFSQLYLIWKSPCILDAHILFISFPNNVFSLHEKEIQTLCFYDFIQSISNIRYKIFCQISCLCFWHQLNQLC